MKTELLDFSLVFPLDHFFFFCFPTVAAAAGAYFKISKEFLFRTGWMGKKERE
jgi:hypothetical protein